MKCPECRSQKVYQCNLESFTNSLYDSMDERVMRVLESSD